MRLLSILSSTSRGGAEQYALTIATAAVQQGWDVHIAFPQVQANRSLIQDFQKANVLYHTLSIAEGKHFPLRILDYFVKFLRTITLLLSVKPDVVKINLPWSYHCFSSILACGVLKIPTIVVFHLVPERTILSKLHLKLYAWARSRNQKWVGVSQYNCRSVAKSFQLEPDEITCIYNGAKLNLTPVQPEEIARQRQRLRQQLGLSETAKLALTVGRLTEQKGHAVLIPAIPHLIRDFPDLKFIWVGDGEQRDHLKQQLQDYGIDHSVLLMGHCQNVLELLRASDLFIFPTLSEGQPFALIEAMAQGIPIVSSEACGIPELIQHQVHGLLVRSGDSCDLLETTRWLLRHPDIGQAMATQARSRVQEFSEAQMISKTLNLLEQWGKQPRALTTSISNCRVQQNSSVMTQSNSPE